MGRKHTTVNLDEELAGRLEEYERRNGISRSDLINKLLKDYIAGNKEISEEKEDGGEQESEDLELDSLNRRLDKVGEGIEDAANQVNELEESAKEEKEEQSLPVISESDINRYVEQFSHKHQGRHLTATIRREKVGLLSQEVTFTFMLIIAIVALIIVYLRYKTDFDNFFASFAKTPSTFGSKWQALHTQQPSQQQTTQEANPPDQLEEAREKFQEWLASQGGERS